MNRFDWRDSLTNAADLALLGVVVILGCLPVATAGAAIAAASVAADRLCTRHAVPGPRELFAAARRTLWSGVAVTGVALVVTAVLLVDVWLLRTAAVPGAQIVTAVLALVAAGLVTVAAVAVVRVGQDQASGLALRGAVVGPPVARRAWQRHRDRHRADGNHARHLAAAARVRAVRVTRRSTARRPTARGAQT